jgi:hypothetical protein
VAAYNTSIYLRRKVQRKEEQKNWTVKQNLCYWMSNEPPITTDFLHKIQWTPKSTDDQRITDADICIFLSTFVHICVPSAGVIQCLVLIQIIYIHIYTHKLFVKTTYKWFQRKKAAQVGLGLPYLMPDCRLEVIFHSEGPETGQLDQSLPWFSFVPEQSWYPNSTLHCMFQPSQW